MFIFKYMIGSNAIISWRRGLPVEVVLGLFSHGNGVPIGRPGNSLGWCSAGGGGLKVGQGRSPW